ncbi:MAG: MBOAT family O-acyltransferase [Longicatena sp.]
MKNNTLSNVYLLIVSLLFYMMFDVKYVLVIILSVLFNYVLGKRVYKNKKILVVGILINVMLLLYFKYFNFFIDSMHLFFNLDYSIARIIAPLGVSFFTFQQISYIVDTFKEKTNYNFISYALHIVFFGYIISGPIVRHHEIIKQFDNPINKKLHWDNIYKGLLCFSKGLFKKVIVADTLAIFVSTGLSDIKALNSTTAFLVMLAYTLQIYFDFSGYSEMAAGVCRFFNLSIPLNFDCPYKAESIQIFWKKWHMSLTRFLTNYIYFPLGGSKKGKIRTYINIMIVFLVSGFWHGASFTFILWGLLHGILNCANRLIKRWDTFHPALKWLVTFGCVNLLWVLFRANSIGEAFQFYKVLFSCNFGNITSLENILVLPEFDLLLTMTGLVRYTQIKAMITMFFFLCIVGYVLIEKNIISELELHYEKYTKITTAITYVMLAFYSLISISGINTFIYVNF